MGPEACSVNGKRENDQEEEEVEELAIKAEEDETLHIHITFSDVSKLLVLKNHNDSVKCTSENQTQNVRYNIR